MDLSVLQKYIDNNDIDEAISIIANIGKNKNKEAIPVLIKYLEETDNGILRNEIAIALSDIGCTQAVEPIINVLRSAKTIGNRGTLLYALESFDYSRYIELIAELLFDDSFEVSRQALVLIESIIGDISNDTKQKIAANIRAEIDDLQDKIDFLQESLNMFIDN